MADRRPRWVQRLMLTCAAIFIMVATQAPGVRAEREQLAPPQPAADWTAPHVPGQLLVKLLEVSIRGGAAGRAGIDAQFVRAGVQEVSSIPELGLAVVEAHPGADLALTATALASSTGVEWVEPNYIFTVDDVALTPDDPYYATHQINNLSRLQMPGAWELTTGRAEIIIAILDTGVRRDHEDLSDSMWTNLDEVPANRVDDDANGFVDDVYGWNFPDDSNEIYDDHSHGTHVAGIAAARINNGVGIAGVAGGATIMPVDVFGGGIGTYEDLIRAIIYATDNGADVINMSLGASSYSRGEQMAVDYAWSNGVVVVAAAGNTGRETYHYPAAHANVIAVAATSESDSLCGFSTRGDFVDVAAPGCSVWSTVPGGYGWKGGTSMATPHVAGLAALILSRNPTLTPDEVRSVIESSADDLGAPGRDTSYGEGRINAHNALAMVTPGGAPTPLPPPPLSIWPQGCQDLVVDGDFESGLAAWRVSGDARVDATQAYTGVQALHFPGGPAASGVATRTITLPSAPAEATLWFAYRIDTDDGGYGVSPQAPHDDWLNADFRTRDGQQLVSLLRTGNTADTSSSGLPWDRYLYRMQTIDFAPLAGAGAVDLVFTAQNDGDDLTTSIWIDAVRFCVTPPVSRQFLPLIRWRE